MIDKQNAVILLNTVELIYLMRVHSVVSASHLGLDETERFTDGELQNARNQLFTAKVLSSNGQIAEKNLLVFNALFSPERSLTAILDVHPQGRQELLFLSYQDIILLITRPDKENYRLELLPQPEQVASLLKNAFPLESLDAGEAFIIPTTLLETLIRLVAVGDSTRAKQALETLPCSQTEKDSLLSTVQNRQISGSILILDLDNNIHALDGFSLAVVADNQSIWVFTQSTPDDNALIAQRSSALFFTIIDILSQRLLVGGSMIDNPLDKNKIVSFSLTPAEFTFCFVQNNRQDIALTVIGSNFPNVSNGSAQFDRLMADARASLLARGWIKIGRGGGVVLAQKLASAISAITSYDYVLQINIVRPNLSASATIHVIKNRLFTSVLRPSQDVYAIEHGDISTLSTYISKLFLDFAQTDIQIDVHEEKIAYPQLVEAMKKQDTALCIKNLVDGGISSKTADLLAQDLLQNLYQGSIVRINVNSHASQEEINGAVKPLFLLLKSQQRSWVYRFTPPEDQGYLILMRNFAAFLEQITLFTAG